MWGPGDLFSHLVVLTYPDFLAVSLQPNSKTLNLELMLLNLYYNSNIPLTCRNLIALLCAVLWKSDKHPSVENWLNKISDIFF